LLHAIPHGADRIDGDAELLQVILMVRIIKFRDLETEMRRREMLAGQDPVRFDSDPRQFDNLMKVRRPDLNTGLPATGCEYKRDGA